MIEVDVLTMSIIQYLIIFQVVWSFFPQIKHNELEVRILVV